MLRTDCEAIGLWSGENKLRLLAKPFNNWRAAMFRMARALRFTAATQDRSLLDALQVVLDNEHRKAEWIAGDVDLWFASERWRKLVKRSESTTPTNRRYLEICVFSHLSGALRSGDVCIDGSESFADYRKQLLPWEECVAEPARWPSSRKLAFTAREK